MQSMQPVMHMSFPAVKQGCTLEVLARADDAVQVAIADADTHPSGNTDLLKNAMVASGFALEGDWYVLEQEETTP